MVKVKDTLTQAAIARAERHAALKARPCKHCGQPIGTLDKRQVRCGLKCPALNKIKTNCLICNKELWRYPKHLQEFNGACCSHACQKIWAGKCGKGVKVDWESRSGKAKLKWINERSSERKSNSVEAKFWVLCKIPKVGEEISEWARRCTTSAKGLNERFIGENVKRKVIVTWKRCFDIALKKLRAKSITKEMSDWQWKVNSVASGLRRRRRIKSLLQGKRNISKHIRQQAQRPRQLSFLE